VRQPVFQNEGGDAVVSQELRDRMTLVIHPQFNITAAWKDDDACARGPFLRGQVNSDGRLMHI
jgi:hypothetical protein